VQGRSITALSLLIRQKLKEEQMWRVKLFDERRCGEILF